MQARELARDADWEELARLARRGGIGGLVASHLEQLEAPRSIRRSLTAVALKTEANNRRLLSVALELCAAAESEGLTLIPLKGIALNLDRPYDDLSLREQSDIDLLARPEQFDAIQELFGTLGCRPSGDHEYSRRHQHHLKFAHGSERAPLLVELHWTAFFVPFQRTKIDAGALEHAQTNETSAGSLRLLDPKDMLLSLALHLAVHRYREQLKWLVDVAEYGRSVAETLDSSSLWQQAAEMRASRAVAHVFKLGRQLLGAPLPQPPEPPRWMPLVTRLSPAAQIVSSERQPGWLRRAAIDVVNHDSVGRGLWALSRKGLELLDRRRIKRQPQDLATVAKGH